MKFGTTGIPAQSARSHRGASRSGGTAVSPRIPIALRSDADISSMRRAGAVLATALDAAREHCVVGSTTAELDLVVRKSIEEQGGSPLFLGYGERYGSDGQARPPFPAATCISINEELVHGVPGARVIRDGDLVSIDAGVRLDGWCADSATTVCVGDVAPERRALVECAEDMLAYAVSAIRPGLRWSTVARGMEAIASAANASIAVDFVGHGIGRELHEAPQVPNSVYASFLAQGDFTLRPGMVLAVEPMVVLEQPKRNGSGELVNPEVSLATDGWTVVLASGAPSCHVEHTVAVTRDGAEVLTCRGVAGDAWRRRAG